MSDVRQYLRVKNFDELQNPKRPNRPTWIKSFVRDLDNPIWMGLTLTNRGFISDFQKLAASMENRVPDDVRFISRKLGIPPRVAGKALNTCVTHELITRFDEDTRTSRNNDLYHLTGTRPILASISPSQSHSMSTGGSNSIDTTGLPVVPETPDSCIRCDGEGCRWCEPQQRNGVKRLSTHASSEKGGVENLVR
jgi:hypothetical protein